MKKSNPLISIVVPVYGVEKYLDKCLNSLLNQSYDNTEIILVDDGSPDNCPEMCDSFAQLHQNVFSYHKPNGGLGSARNYGVEKANGEWIVFVDSDDYVGPNYVRDMVQLQKKYDADMVSCGAISMDESGKILSVFSTDEVCRTSKEAFADIYFYGKSGHCSWAKLMRRDTLQKFPFPSGYFEDLATTYLYIGECDKVVLAGYAENYYYIQRSGSILKSKLNEKHLQCFTICDTISEYILKKYPEYKRLIFNLYDGQVVQILRKQSLTNEEYSKVFMLYRKRFIRDRLYSMLDGNLSVTFKICSLLLCASPGLFRFVMRIKDRGEFRD
ncbi:glycosyltransferase family 2 protein [Holdemania massiliensis]|uniref:glycosyltransferase family 2 protein n=1 Tax=Holdemania massiliensis TaxID=1468449 RepID=UPI0002EC0F74|nr:glycosyltransferase family 2 protein [Holdemania massiliensis]